MFVFPDVGSGGTLQPNLASIVGALPAGYNMLPTPGGTQGFQTDWTDFSNSRNWSVTGTESRPTAAQLTLVGGLSGPDSSAHATRLVETTLNDNHSVCSSYLDPTGSFVVFNWNTMDAPIPLRTAAIIRAQERTRAVLGFLAGNSLAAYQVSVGYDLAGGNTGYDNLVGANMTLIGTHMSNLGGGFWLCYFDHYCSSGATTPSSPNNHNYQPTIFLDNGSGTAARSISYAGDVTKGLEVLWFNVLPVAMWNINTLAFQDDFTSLSTIDLTNSKAPGFKWYINNHFPNSGNGSLVGGVADWSIFWNIAGITIPSNPANFSIVSPSILQIDEATVSSSPGFTNQMWSVASTSNTPGTVPGYIGSAFPAPLFVEWSMVCDTSRTDNNPFWQGDGPIIWGSTIPTLTQVGFAGDGKAHFIEWDVVGGGNANPAMGSVIHDWFDPNGAGPGSDKNAAFAINQGVFSTTGNPDNPQMLPKNGFRKSACLWVNCAYNNYSWGFFISFGDGHYVRPAGFDIVYNPAFVLSVSDPQAGYISLSDGHLMPIFLTAPGSNNALAPNGQIAQIDWVRAWTVASPPTVYAFWNAFDMGTAGTTGLTSTVSQNGYQVTKPGADASWQSARAHICVGYNKTGLPFSGGVGTGKWYWEHTLTGNSMGNTSDFILGFGNTSATVVGNYPGSSAKGAGLQYNTAANTNVNGVTGLTASSITWAANDVIGFAFDADAGHVYVHKNGTYINGNPGSGNGVWTVSGDTWWPMVAMLTAGSTNAVSSNFGQAAFAFTVPSGYNAGVY